MLKPIIAGLVVAGFAAAAEAAPYQIDPTHTQIMFDISHMGYSQTHGVFKSFTSNVSFDPDKPEKTKVEITIDANSVDTFFAPRDTHLKSKDFFDVEKHPTITFKSKSVSVSGETAKLTGDLTLHGVTKPIMLDVNLNAKGNNAMMPSIQVAGFAASGKIKRSDFDMSWGLPGIGDEVGITIQAELNNAPPRPAQ